MPSDLGSLHKERVFTRTILVAILFLAAGVGLLWWASNVTSHPWQAFLREAGSALFVAGVLGGAWEWLGKKAFVESMLHKAGISRNLSSAGILQVEQSFQSPAIDWAGLFTPCRELDMFFAYAYSWRNTHVDQIAACLSYAGSRVRVVLPDPDNDSVLRELSRRYEKPPAEIAGKIKDAIAFFGKLKKSVPQGGGTLTAWTVAFCPLYTLYRFDDRLVLTLLPHRTDKSAVPTFISERGGILHDFAMGDFDAMITTMAKPIQF